jgi:hypothetical protein
MIVKEIKVQEQQLKNKHKLQDLILTMEVKDKIVNLLRVLEIKTLLLFSTI